MQPHRKPIKKTERDKVYLIIRIAALTLIAAVLFGGLALFLYYWPSS